MQAMSRATTVQHVYVFFDNFGDLFEAHNYRVYLAMSQSNRDVRMHKPQQVWMLLVRQYNDFQLNPPRSAQFLSRKQEYLNHDPFSHN